MPERYDDLSEYAWLMDQVILHEEPQAMAIGRVLYEKLRPGSVLDIGCGPGIYLVPFKLIGCKVRGIDGCPPPEGGKSLDPDEFEVVDLRGEWKSPKYYDLVLCIEVAEHMKEEYSDHLVEIISRSGREIFFTAARPGQGGENHLTERPMEWWLEKFARNEKYLHPINGEITLAMANDPVYDHCGWLRNGVLLGPP